MVPPRSRDVYRQVRYRITPIPSALPSLGAHRAGGRERRRDDRLIPRAAADIAGDGVAHLRLARLRIAFEKLGQGDQHARRAEAALQAVILAERLLQRVERAADARAPPRSRPRGRRPARPASGRSARSAVHQHSAGAADAVLAAEMRAGQAAARGAGNQPASCASRPRARPGSR